MEMVINIWDKEILLYFNNKVTIAIIQINNKMRILCYKQIQETHFPIILTALKALI